MAGAWNKNIGYQSTSWGAPLEPDHRLVIGARGVAARSGSLEACMCDTWLFRSSSILLSKELRRDGCKELHSAIHRNINTRLVASPPSIQSSYSLSSARKRSRVA